MELEKYKTIFFIGIGGISMSSLAKILKSEGHVITGSNNVENDCVPDLLKQDISVSIGHDEKNIYEGIDLVVFTSSIAETNVELEKARKLGILCIERATLLGELMKKYPSSITVSGTHGKTTTTSMISEIFLEAGLDPTISNGGILKSIQSNTRIGKSPYFIAEACEYKDAFLKFHPRTAAILNIEADHLDYFKDLEAIYRSFEQFIMNIHPDGTVVINKNIGEYQKLIENFRGTVLTYGNESANLYSSNISYDEDGVASYDLIQNGKFVCTIKLSVPGEHNVSNSLAAIAIALSYRVDIESIQRGIQNFTGSKRRLDFIGEYQEIRLMDDYAHHPTEIHASIKTAKMMRHHAIWVVFQSHTYTRTKALLREFGHSLSGADYVIITDIYAAREENTVNVYPADLVNEIQKYNKNAIYIKDFEEIAVYLKEHCAKQDIVMFMGAGEANKIGYRLIEENV